MTDFQVFMHLQCPICRDNGEKSVVLYKLNDGVINELQCRKCEYTDTPKVFEQDSLA